MRIQLRGLGIGATPAIEEHVERRLLFALGRFARRVDNVVVRFEDLNGPRGGVDKACRVEARLRPGGAVRVAERNEDLYTAVDRAADRIGRAVRRELDRRLKRHRRGPLRPLFGPA